MPAFIFSFYFTGAVDLQRQCYREARNVFMYKEKAEVCLVVYSVLPSSV